MVQVDAQKSRQTTIQEWTKKDGNPSNPEGRKEVKAVPKTPQKRRMRGKLTKKEQLMMKKTHRDIGWLLSPPPEVRNHERVLEREVEVMEIVDGDKEERLERMRLRTLEWKAKHDCRGILTDLIGDAMMESDGRQQACRDLVMESVENAMMESRRRLCKELMMETIVTGA